VSEITDTGYTRRQYGTESSLETRRSVWRDSPDGRNPATLAADAAYLSSFDATMADRLPWFEGGREYTGTPTVFLAR
jgi:hypothetical protein